MSSNLIIGLLIVISITLMYCYSSKNNLIKEDFENLPMKNKIDLTNKIRNDNTTLSQEIDSIASEIQKREEHYKSLERKHLKNSELILKESNDLNKDNTSDDMKAVAQVTIKEQIVDNANNTESLPDAKTALVDMADYIHKSNIPDMSSLIPKSVLKGYVRKDKLPDMKRYILRSQVPVPPNMNKYILRSQVPECPKMPDMTHYVRKTEIPQPVSCPDMTKFVLKTSVPPCHKPVCPKPVCPKPNCLPCNSKKVSAEKTDEKKQLEKTKKATKTKKAAKVTSEKPQVVKDNSQIVQTITLPKKFFPQAAKRKQQSAKKKQEVKTNPKIKQKLDLIKQECAKYKPNVQEKKCTLFKRIVKNVDVYGAY